MDVKEIEVIRADQRKVVEETYSKLKKNQVVSTMEFARLGTKLGNLTVGAADMCPLLESNYQSQISRSLANTFPKELKRCPSSQEEMRRQYQEIISSDLLSKLSVQESWQVLDKNLQALKDNYTGQCGLARVRPRHRLGLFGARAPADR